MTMYLKKLNFDILTPIPGSGGVWGKDLLPCCFILHSICNMTMFYKKLSFDLSTPSPGSGGVGGSTGKIFATMFQHFVIPFNEICNLTMFWKSRYHKLRKTFSKFYRRYHDLISKFQVGLKSLLRQGLSEPDFYGDLVYKLRKIVGSNNFSAQFIKIISHYKKNWL